MNIEKKLLDTDPGSKATLTITSPVDRTASYTIPRTASNNVVVDITGGCEYCNGETPIADTMDSLQRGSMLIVGGKRLVVDMPTDYISEEICYCPMCGKRLEVWHDAD